MAWTAARTWVSDEIVTAAQFNEQIRDNLNYLNIRPSDLYVLNEGADYTIATSTWTDVDATDLALTITTNGGDVLISFAPTILNGASTNTATYLDVTIDAVREGGDDGLAKVLNLSPAEEHMLPMIYLKTGLSAGSHTFKVQWKRVGSGTMTMYAGAATANSDIHPQFFVKEL